MKHTAGIYADRIMTAAHGPMPSPKLLDHVGDGILLLNARDGVVSYANDAAERLLGRGRDSLLGRSIEALLPLSGEPPLTRWSAVLGRATTDDGPAVTHSLVRTASGREQYLRVLLQALPVGEGPQGIVLTLADVSEIRALADTMRHQATHDALTGLPNRALLFERLDEALRDRPSAHQLGVLFVDLDQFKAINDGLGHAAGDKLLKDVAARLRASLRTPSDAVARLSGDEFVIVVDPIEQRAEAAAAAVRLLNAFERPFVIEGHELQVSASVGVSIFPEDGPDGSALVKNADVAMYRSKQHGGNRVGYYHRDMNARAFDRLVMRSLLRLGLQRDEFFLHYQPRYDLKGANVVGLEALIRWRQPERGLIPPIDFIPIAEETGLIMPIGEWVLRQACAQMHAWRGQGLQAPHVAVNLSAQQFQQPNLADTVARTAQAFGIEPPSLMLEITESLIMQDVEVAMQSLRALKRLGVMIAVDDFGTGHSSLSYLKRFPIDYLKIDQSFIRNIGQNVEDEAIVRTIVALADSLRLKVVAEGVERADQLAFLQELGCDEAQGFLLGRPGLPVDIEPRFHAASSA